MHYMCSTSGRSLVVVLNTLCCIHCLGGATMQPNVGALSRETWLFPADFYLSCKEFRMLKAKYRAWDHHVVFWPFQWCAESGNKFIVCKSALLI